ncbi:recombinase family protein [Bifidobacterium callitrichos]|uniref:Recombinase family protein n=2 Tax=Bifidobacterium callitrichos TaxID=762209 RepID=A0A5M9Z9I3_9BIFI|nr:recombinase family protein [Bifidobacterium callitrichos]
MSQNSSNLSGYGTFGGMEKRFGYARVSTAGQSADLQIDALEQAGCDRIFIDAASGAKAHRPELDHMIELLREGDVVVVWRMDRLGRSMQNLVELMNRFQELGVGFVSLTEAIDTTTPGGMLTFNLFAALSQFERDLIRERTQAGLEAARARGRTGGRPAKLDERRIDEIHRLYDSKTLTVRQIAELMHVSRSTVYRLLEERRTVKARKSVTAE